MTWRTTKALAATLLVWLGASACGQNARTQDAGAHAESWGPPTGTPMPALTAPDQQGMQRSLSALAGERGLLFLIARSADW